MYNTFTVNIMVTTIHQMPMCMYMQVVQVALTAEQEEMLDTPTPQPLDGQWKCMCSHVVLVCQSGPYCTACQFLSIQTLHLTQPAPLLIGWYMYKCKNVHVQAQPGHYLTSVSPSLSCLLSHSIVHGIGELDVSIEESCPPPLPPTSPYLLLDVRDKDDYQQCHIITGLQYMYDCVQVQCTCMTVFSAHCAMQMCAM